KDRALETALQDKTPTTITPLNEKLETLARGTQAAVIYLVGMDGVAIAASNWREPDSFVGNDYKFRPYFHNALRNGDAEYFRSQRTGHWKLHCRTRRPRRSLP